MMPGDALRRLRSATSRSPGREVDGPVQWSAHDDVEVAVPRVHLAEEVDVRGYPVAHDQHLASVGRPDGFGEAPGTGCRAEGSEVMSVRADREDRSGTRRSVTFRGDVERQETAVRGPPRMLECRPGRYHLTQVGAISTDDIDGFILREVGGTGRV